MTNNKVIKIDDNELYDEINVVPMLDLSYVLLLIFIILTTVAVQGLQVDLPNSQSRTDLGNKNVRAITLEADGAIYMDTVSVTLAQLENALRQDAASGTETSIIVKAAGAVPYQRIILVLNLAQKFGVTEIGLATQNNYNKKQLN